MRRRLVLVLLLGCAGAVAVAVLVVRSGGDEPAGCRRRRSRAVPEPAPGRFARLLDAEFLAAVEGKDDPRPAVAAIADAAWSEGGFLLSSCHGLMHTVGRTYAREAGITLADLMDYLPQSNDPGCSAGFAHGLVTGVGAQIDPRRPGEAAARLHRRRHALPALQLRARARARVHAGLRRPARACARPLPLARVAVGGRLRPGRLPRLLVRGRRRRRREPADGAITDPRRLCGAQPTAFVRPCWYRAFVDNRPEGIVVDSPEHLDVLCEGLDGLQREACVTGAAVIGPADPTAQLKLCAGLADPSDAAGCIRGTKAQNLLGAPASDFVRLIGRCELFAGVTRDGCYRWLGKAIAVLTDGAFAQSGCPKLAKADARRNCTCGCADDGRRARHVQLRVTVDRTLDKEADMPLARVVTFDGVSSDRMAEMQKEMEGSEQPDDVPAKEIVVLHDPDNDRSVVILFFESDDDYRRGDEALNAMSTADTPGQRTSVTKYQVAFRMSN